MKSASSKTNLALSGASHQPSNTDLVSDVTLAANRTRLDTLAMIDEGSIVD